MKPRSLIRDYMSRLIHQALVQVTGGLGFLLTAFMELALPGVIIKWVFYLIILVAGLVAGGYQVFVDIVKEHQREADELKDKIASLERKLQDLELRQPNILVGIQDRNQLLVQRIQLQLRPLPPRPAIEDLVAQRRDELLAKSKRSRVIQDSRLKITLDILGEPNPNYETEVKEYLQNYCRYLIRQYEQSIFKDRFRTITPIVENRGFVPATNVTFELTMPSAFRPASQEHFLAANYASIGKDYSPSPPKEPNLFNPVKLSSGFHIPAFPLNEQSTSHKEPSNTDGPEINERNGVYHVVYKIEKLIQNRPEINFGSLYLWLGDLEQSTTWEIPIAIYAAELPRPLEDTVRIDFAVIDS